MLHLIKVGSVISKEDFVSSLENRYSCWLKLKLVIALILKLKVNHNRKQSMLTGENNKTTINFTNENLHILDTSQIQQAERCVIKLIESKYFNKEMKKLLIKKQGSEGAKIKKSNQIYSLDPYIDKDGVIKVGGRLDKSNLNKGSHISKLIIQSHGVIKNCPRRERHDT